MPKLSLGENGFILGQPFHDVIKRQEILSFAVKQGFDGIELHAGFEPYVRGKEREIRKEYESLGLEIPCIQTSNAAATHQNIMDDNVFKDYVKVMGELIEFAHNVGAENVTVSPPRFLMGHSYDSVVERFLDFCGQIVEFVEKNDVVLAVRKNRFDPKGLE